MPGIITSSRMRSGRDFSATTSACSPVAAVTVRYPAVPSSWATRSTLSGSSSTTRTVAPSAAKVALEFLEQERLVDRLRQEIIAAAGARALLVGAHGPRREHDHRDMCQRRITFQPPRRLPAVHA